jgi:hypothetical protein
MAPAIVYGMNTKTLTTLISLFTILSIVLLSGLVSLPVKACHTNTVAEYKPRSTPRGDKYKRQHFRFAELNVSTHSIG